MTAVSTIGGATSTAALASLRTGLADEQRHAVARRSPTEVTPAAARAIIATAGQGALAVMDLLSQIETVVIYASNEGLILESPFARATRQAQADQMIAQLDRLVALADVGGINLLSGAGGAAGFRTTAFGGTFEVDPKPLDSASLRLRGLDIMSDAEVYNALGRVARAKGLAEIRSAQLAGLNLVFASGATFLDHINGTADHGTASQVDLLA